MKLQLLPSSFAENGDFSPKQHLACFVIDDSVAIDAGSLAMATGAAQKEQIRDVVLTHAHLDHIAGLPLFVDDAFADLREPICVHAAKEVVEKLEQHVFNWEIYPRFSELKNKNGAIMEYRVFQVETEFSARHLTIKPIAVNHKVNSVGLIISDERSKIALTGDTARMERFWEIVNGETDLRAVLIECAFPNELSDLAEASHHLTPQNLRSELEKFENKDCPVFVINMKPMYREKIVAQLTDLKIRNLKILEVGRVYEW